MDKAVEFEVLDNNEEFVTFKRVLSKKKLSPKEKNKREMSLPKLTLNYFDEDDLRELQSIEVEDYLSVKTRFFKTTRSKHNLLYCFFLFLTR
ncbi:MAG: hypothetical protein LBV11_18575 [Bacillus cereus]|jgi:hypothetical protein|nr:hypothetical protein [Bacillus cereus]